MSYEYCRECCHELRATDEFCPECKAPTRFRLFGRDERRLGIGHFIGLGMIFLSFAIEFSDYGPMGAGSLTSWLIIAGILICGFSPYRN
jgi:hypothetical protein